MEKTENKTLSELKDKNTIVRSFKQKVSDKLDQLKDLATLEIAMPIEARLRERLKSIKNMSSASSIKIDGMWSTRAPEIHITKLQAKKISNELGEITFEVFEVDKDGNKKLYEHQTEIIKENGDKIKRTTSAEYRIAYRVKEIIKRHKVIEKEITDFELRR